MFKPFKGASRMNISQGFHDAHKAIDWVSSYGTLLVAPEKVRIEWIIGDKYTPESFEGMKQGYGIWMTGLETGYIYIYWHLLPIFPVSNGDVVQGGKIIGFMGNSGYVKSNNIEVPVDEDRTKLPYKGTHLHQAMFAPGHKIGVWKGDELNPLLLTDFNTEPNYTIMEQILATSKVVLKLLKLLAID